VHPSLGPRVSGAGRSRYADAASEFRRGDRGPCGASCGLAELGIAYDRLGETDSAIAAYERYLARPNIIRIDWDAHLPARTYERLGGLYLAKGDRESAAEYYSRFISLWKDCDPELQPRVATARAALARLGRRVP
jgi:tetratricopeptide (TPR) repeat protein